MFLSHTVQDQLKRSNWIRKMFNEGLAMKSVSGETSVFDLSLGNPVFEPSAEVFEALQNLVSEPVIGVHRYMDNAGFSAAREVVAVALQQKFHLPYTKNNIIMTSGASCSLRIVLQSLLSQGDEVIILAPFFGPYSLFVESVGGKPVIVSTTSEFRPDMQVIERVISAKTSCILINSPNNPTGAVFPAEDYVALAELLQRKSQQFGRPIIAVSDEVYEGIVFDGRDCPQISSYYPNTVIVNSYSKSLNIPGERIGYVAIHPDFPSLQDFFSALIHCMQIVGFVNAPALMQRLVVKVHPIHVDPLKYQNKRDFLYKALTSMGYNVFRPQGAFYMLVQSPFEDEMEFVEALKSYKVLVVPGTGLGAGGYVRLAFCVEDWVLEGAVQGFKKVSLMHKRGRNE